MKTIKELTDEFKKCYESFDINNVQFAILVRMLDIIIDMMLITSIQDHLKLKKLTSFTKVISSDFCADVVGKEGIDDIYNGTILPLLNYLDEAYSNINENPSYEDKEYIDNIDIPTIEVEVENETMKENLSDSITQLILVTKRVSASDMDSSYLNNCKGILHELGVSLNTCKANEKVSEIIKQILFLCSILMRQLDRYKITADTKMIEFHKLKAIANIVSCNLRCIKLK